MSGGGADTSFLVLKFYFFWVGGVRRQQSEGPQALCRATAGLLYIEDVSFLEEDVVGVHLRRFFTPART